MLQQHQLRVASVGFTILKEMNLVEDDMVSALLVHDLGNVIRIRFDLFSESEYGEDGVEYFKNKQKEYLIKYGNVDHTVTVKMLEEVNVDEDIIKMVELVNWENIEGAVKSDDMILKILNYSDMRVGPFGILPAIVRIDEVNKRKASWPEYSVIREKIVELENQIFKSTKILPQDINDKSIVDIIPQLRNWQI
jgi:hypothetical protein